MEMVQPSSSSSSTPSPSPSPSPSLSPLSSPPSLLDSSNSNPSPMGTEMTPLQDTIIVLSSDSEPEAESPVSNLSSDNTDVDLELVNDMQRMQKLLQLKLNKLEKRAIKRKSNKQQASSQGGAVVSAALELPKQVEPTTSFLESLEAKRGLKRKLEFLTEELSLSRTKNAKKMRNNMPKEQMVIEIPDFPMEYYVIGTKNLQCKSDLKTAEDWFSYFNKTFQVQNNGNYSRWITERTNSTLSEVLRIMQNSQKRGGVPTDHLLGKAELLSCRRVCKSWKQSIDKYLQEDCASRGLDCDIGNSLATKISSKDTVKFVQMVGWSQNLFAYYGARVHAHVHLLPSQHLVVETYPFDNTDNAIFFEKALGTFLDMFGNVVSYFTYISHLDTSNFFNSSKPKGLFCLIYLRPWLLKMPNLRSIDFKFLSPTCSRKEGTLEPLTLVPVSFPHLSKLESIQCHNGPSILMNSMLTSNPQIKRLGTFESYDTNLLPLSWTELGKLRNLSQFSVNISQITQLFTLENVKWPLCKLSLTSAWSMQEPWNLSKIFSVLETFGGTLRHLTLKMSVKIPDKDLNLKLPQLQELNLHIQEKSDDKISYDFILPLESLTWLKVDFGDGSESRNNGSSSIGDTNDNDQHHEIEMIQLKSFKSRLYDSNIWRLFPFLQNIILISSNKPRVTYNYFRDRLKM